MKPLSIRWRITVWITSCFALVLLGSGAAIYVLLLQTHLRQVDRQLRNGFVNLRRVSDSVSEPEALLESIPNEQASEGLWVLQDQTGRVVAANAGISGNVLTGLRLDNGGRIATLEDDSGRRYRYLSDRLTISGQQYVTTLAMDLHHVEEEMQQVLMVLVVTIPTSLVIAVALAHLLAWKAISPLEDLRRRTDEITARELHRRLPIANPTDELGQLALTINAMIARLEASFEGMKRFTADASHELRTPVAIIQSEAELGRDDSHAPPSIRERFHSILEECRRLAVMTSQLLTLSREDAGVFPLQRQKFDLAALLCDTASSLQPLAHAHEQTLTCDIRAELPLVGDQDRLRQVIYNLLENAIKYAGKKARIEVTAFSTSVEVCFSVTDTGPGIPREHIGRVFDRFYRVPRESAGAGGAGLGMSIVKGIVSAHGGDVSLTEETERGTTVNVRLPVERA